MSRARASGAQHACSSCAGWSRSSQHWVERTIFWRVWERMLENEFLDRSVALAAKAFVSLFPALIVVASFMPQSIRIFHLLVDHAPSGTDWPRPGNVQGRVRERRTTPAKPPASSVFSSRSSSSIRSHRARAACTSRRGAARSRAGCRRTRWARSWLARHRGVLRPARRAPRRVRRADPKTAAFALLAWAAAIGLWWLTPWLMLAAPRAAPGPLHDSAVLTGTAHHRSTAPLRRSGCRGRWTENQQQFGFFGVALVAGHLADRCRRHHRRGRVCRRRSWPRTRACSAASSGAETTRRSSCRAPPRRCRRRCAAPTLTDALGISRATGGGDDDEREADSRNVAKSPAIGVMTKAAVLSAMLAGQQVPSRGRTSMLAEQWGVGQFLWSLHLVHVVLHLDLAADHRVLRHLPQPRHGRLRQVPLGAVHHPRAVPRRVRVPDRTRPQDERARGAGRPG